MNQRESTDMLDYTLPQVSLQISLNIARVVIKRNMAESGDHNVCDKCVSKDAIVEEIKPLCKKGGLIVIDLPPSPEDVCKICDPVFETDKRVAVFSTIFCWMPLGILPAIFGLIGIHFAVKAETSEIAEERLLYNRRSATISWIGMMLFITVLTVATIIVATCGIL